MNTNAPLTACTHINNATRFADRLAAETAADRCRTANAAWTANGGEAFDDRVGVLEWDGAYFVGLGEFYMCGEAK